MVVLIDQVVQVVVGLQDDIAASAAVAATGTTLGSIGLAVECDASLSAMAGAGEYFNLINKHTKKQRARPADLALMKELLTLILGGVGGRSRSGLGRDDIHPPAAAIEADFAVHKRKQGPIATRADIFAGEESGAALTDQDAAGGDDLPAVTFHSQTFADAVASVPDAALTFFMCHILIRFLRSNLRSKSCFLRLGAEDRS